MDLTPRWRLWLQRIGRVQTHLLMGLSYVIVIAPFAGVARGWADFLRRRRPRRSNWHIRPQETGTISERVRQPW